jgi:tRNA (guanine-N7-)-methyltransferase
MQSFSSEVVSSQIAVHLQLEAIVQRHLQHPDRTPIATHSLSDWPELQSFLQNAKGHVLDLGCGTGLSTIQLAERYPNHAVLGVDRSMDRLSRTDAVRPNVRLARFDQFDLLRLCRQSNLIADKVYLLYPNPSPKPDQIKRRWHAHPIWPCLLATARAIELRTNWAIYAEEFASALRLSGIAAEVRPLANIKTEAALTRFEAKYHASGHALWQVLADVPK